jgi:hypothetical protein
MPGVPPRHKPRRPALDYERGHLTVHAATGVVLVPYEVIGYSTCPSCGLDTLANVITHTPCCMNVWTSCDNCTDDPSHDEGV